MLRLAFTLQVLQSTLSSLLDIEISPIPSELGRAPAPCFPVVRTQSARSAWRTFEFAQTELLVGRFHSPKLVGTWRRSLADFPRLFNGVCENLSRPSRHAISRVRIPARVNVTDISCASLAPFSPCHVRCRCSFERCFKTLHI